MKKTLAETFQKWSEKKSIYLLSLDTFKSSWALSFDSSSPSAYILLVLVDSSSVFTTMKTELFCWKNNSVQCIHSVMNLQCNQF